MLTSAEKAVNKAVKKKLTKAKTNRTAYRKTVKKTVKQATTPTRAKGLVRTDDLLDSLPPKQREEIESNAIFKPNPGPQEEFLASPERDVLYGGQAGGGKSYSIIIDPLRYAHNKNHKALLLRKTMPELRELIDHTRELYPRAFPGARFKEQEKVWTFPSGAKLEFGFLDKDADVYRYQGQAFTWIGFDELTHLKTEAPWNYLGSRLRTTDPTIELYMRATTNPGGPGHAWVKARYIDPAEPNTPFVYGTNKITGDALYRKFIPAQLKDNPYLYQDGDYETMLETLPEVERRRLLHGDWNINEGVAFPEFNRDTHVIEPFKIPEHWVRFKGADYGYTSPSAVLWFAVDPEDNTIICYRELYVKGLTGAELGQQIMFMELQDPTTVPGVLDTAAWNRTGYTGPTIGQELNKLGCKFRPADKNRIGGKIQVHERLKQKESGRPGLVIFNTCKGLITELESLPLSTTNSEDVDTHAVDHAYDALRYAMMSRPKMTTNAERLGIIKRDVHLVSDNAFGY